MFVERTNLFRQKFLGHDNNNYNSVFNGYCLRKKNVYVCMYVLSTYLSISTYLHIYEYYSSKELFRYKVIGTQLNQTSHNS